MIEKYYSEDSFDFSFDLTVLTDVIEHIHDVDIFWKSAKSNINKGKFLYIETPPPKNFERMDISNDLFKAPHLYFYSRSHIDNLANKYGFSLQNSREVMHRGVLKDWYLLSKE